MELNIEIGEDDADHLLREEIFIEIYKFIFWIRIMFPLLVNNLEELAEKDLETGEKI